MKKIIAALAIMLGLSAPLMAITISTTTAGIAPTTALLLQKNESLDWSISGTFTGVTRIEKSIDGTNFAPVGISTTNNAVSTLTGTLYSGAGIGFYRWNASTITAGSFVYSMSDNDDFVTEQLNNKNVPITQTYDDTFRINGGQVVSGPIKIGDNVLGSAVTAAVGTNGTDFSNWVPVHNIGAAVIQGQVLIASGTGTGYVATQPGTISLTSVVGVAAEAIAEATNGWMIPRGGGFGFILTTGTVAIGDILVTTGTVAGYAGSDTTPTTGADFATSLETGTDSGGTVLAILH